MATLDGNKTIAELVRELEGARERIAELTEDSNVRFRALIESSQALVWRLDLEGRYTSLSPAWEHTFGYSREEMLGRCVGDFQRPDVRERDLEAFARNPLGVFVAGYETSQLAKDGHEIHLSISTAPAYGADGQVNGLQGTAEDITDRRRSVEALRQSEARYALTLGALDDGLWDWHVPSGDAYFSIVYYALLGYDDREFPANYESWRLLVHPDDLDRVERELRLGFESGGKFDIELRMKMKSGAWLWVATRGKTIEREADGRAIRMVGTLTDITERKRADAEKAALLVQLERTGELAKVGGWELDLSTMKMQFSKESLRINDVDPAVGLTLEQALERVSPNFRAVFATAVQAAISDGTAFDLAVPMVTVTGRHIWSRTQCFAVMEGGKAIKLVGTFQDITERKQRESELADVVRRLQLATRSARMGVWDWDVVDNVMTWDDRMFELYGVGKNDFPACIDAWQSGLHPEDRERAVSECQDALDGTADFDTTFRVRHPDGTIKFIQANGLVIRDENGAAARMLGLNWDITGPTQAAAERAHLEAQLHQSQKMESVGRLAGGVAHDFNNMLGAILANVEFALEQVGPNERLREDLEEIRSAALRSADLTRQLLTFARRQTVSRKVLNLNDALAGILMMLRRLIGEDIELSSRPGEGLWLVKVDPSQIDQILTNLCINARDAISGVGKLIVETDNVRFDDDYCAAHPESAPGDHVRLTISDDGRGMDKETQSHLFEPFFTTKAMGKGTGLGLATVYGIVKQNHGTIEVYSEPGHGTTFRIYLPRHQSTPLPARTEAAPTVRGHETILLVEDEPAILKASRRMLEQLGYVVLPAGTAVEAMRLAKEHTGELHLLMTDIVMPEMNGRDLARNLTSLYPGLERLFMSGYTADVIAYHGVLDEGVHFIQKPFSREELAAKVRRALDRKPAS